LLGRSFDRPDHCVLSRLLAIMTAVVLVLVLTAGCTPVPPPSGQTGIPPGGLGISATPREDGKGDKDITYISPAKIDIENLYPGATGEFELEVHNGKDMPCTFSITARPADSAEAPFEPLPKEYLGWVKIPEPSLLVPPKESKFVTIAVTMPPDATVKQKKYELLIAVKDTSQTSFIQIELGLRVMVSTQ